MKEKKFYYWIHICGKGYDDDILQHLGVGSEILKKT